MASGRAIGWFRPGLGHTPLGALTICNPPEEALAIAASGWMMVTDAFRGIGRLKDIDEGLINRVLVIAVLQSVAVIVKARRTGINLLPAMIPGTEPVPEDRAAQIPAAGPARR